MKLGYACINMTLQAAGGITTNRGMRQKTFNERGLPYVSELALQNVKDLVNIIKWNNEMGIRLFRMSSDIFPWMSYYQLDELPDYEEISDYLLSTLSTIDFKDTVLYKSNNYFKNCLNNYFKVGIVANNKECIHLFENELTGLQRKIITNLIARGISFYSEDQIEANYQALTRIVKDDKELAKYTELYNKINSLVKGNPSPSFSYKSIDGDTVSLNDLEGKLVYIDVWATWCGPCKAQFPYLKKLEEDYRAMDVAFVSISIDNPKSEDKWRKMVQDKELKGIQLIAENAWKSSFAQDYVIRGIPRFILLDKNGNIISPFAPQPAIYDESGNAISNKEINDLLDEHLN